MIKPQIIDIAIKTTPNEPMISFINYNYYKLFALLFFQIIQICMKTFLQLAQREHGYKC